MEARKQFTFYRSYYEALRLLPENHRLKALEAVIAYALDGTEPQGLDDMQMMAFMLIKPTLDSARKMAAGGSKRKVGQRLGKGMGKEKEKEKEDESEGETEKEREIENELEDECHMAEGFERFWEIYPVKVGKKQAREVWDQLRPDADALCDNLRQWKDTAQWCRENGRFIPRAAKFLRERHFEGLPADYIPRGATGVLGEAELEAIRKVMAG